VNLSGTTESYAAPIFVSVYVAVLCLCLLYFGAGISQSV
jgi:hypothetical protein